MCVLCYTKLYYLSPILLQLYNIKAFLKVSIIKPFLEIKIIFKANIEAFFEANIVLKDLQPIGVSINHILVLLCLEAHSRIVYRI